MKTNKQINKQTNKQNKVALLAVIISALFLSMPINGFTAEPQQNPFDNPPAFKEIKFVPPGSTDLDPVNALGSGAFGYQTGDGFRFEEVIITPLTPVENDKPKAVFYFESWINEECTPGQLCG